MRSDIQLNNHRWVFVTLLLVLSCPAVLQSCSGGDEGLAETISSSKPAKDASLSGICRKWEWSRKGKIGAVDEAGTAVFHPEASGDDLGKYMFVSNLSAGHEGKFTPTEEAQAILAGKTAGQLLEGIFFVKLNEYVYEAGMTEEQKDAVTALTDAKEQFVKLNLTGLPAGSTPPSDVESMLLYRIIENGVTVSYLVMIEIEQITVVKMPDLATLKGALKTSLSEASTGAVNAEIVKTFKWKLQDPGFSGFDEPQVRAAVRAAAIRPKANTEAALNLTASPGIISNAADAALYAINFVMANSLDISTVTALNSSAKYIGAQLNFSISIADLVSQASGTTLSPAFKGRMPQEFVVAAMIKGLRQLMALAGGKLDPNLYYNTEMQAQFKTWGLQYVELRDTLKASSDPTLQDMGKSLEALVEKNLSELYTQISEFESSAKKTTIDQLIAVLEASKYDKSHLFGFLIPSELSFNTGFTLYGTFAGMMYGQLDWEEMPKETADYLNYFKKVSNRIFVLPYKKKYQTAMIQPEVAMFGQDDPYEMITIGERRPNVIKAFSKLNDYLDEYGRIKDEGDTTTVFSAKCLDKRAGLIEDGG